MIAFRAVCASGAPSPRYLMRAARHACVAGRAGLLREATGAATAAATATSTSTSISHARRRRDDEPHRRGVRCSSNDRSGGGGVGVDRTRAGNDGGVSGEGGKGKSEDDGEGDGDLEGEAAAAAEWPAHEYADAARTTLDALYEGALAAAEDGALGADFDAEFDGDVVRLQLGDGRGTYVANTQTPNRQIWLSSPVSGPWRYAWSAERRQWVSTRDGHPLLALIERELSHLAGRPIVIADASQMR